MKRLLLSLLILVAAPQAWGDDSIGKIVDLAGESWITHSGEKASIAFVNQEIYLNDVIKTAKSGAVKILFADDTLLTVKESASVLISEFLFNPKHKERKVTFNASYGRIRTLIGKFFGKDQPVEVHTPTAVAGIRGTDVAFDVGLSTGIYCFICEENVFSVYNPDFPNQQVSLVTGQSIEIFKKKAALERAIVPIPEDILDRKEFLFDIKKGETAKAAETTVQITQKDTAGTATPLQAATSEKTLLNQTENTQTEESHTTSNPGTIDSGDNSVNPGGTQQNAPTVHVTVSTPGS